MFDANCGGWIVEVNTDVQLKWGSMFLLSCARWRWRRTVRRPNRGRRPASRLCRNHWIRPQLMQEAGDEERSTETHNSTNAIHTHTQTASTRSNECTATAAERRSKKIARLAGKLVDFHWSQLINTFLFFLLLLILSSLLYVLFY